MFLLLLLLIFFMGLWSMAGVVFFILGHGACKVN